MRQTRQKQLNLQAEWLHFEHAKELQAIAGLLDEHPMVAALVWQDLAPKGLLKDTGAEGLSAEQVLRALVIKQLNGFSYRELAWGWGIGEGIGKSISRSTPRSVKYRAFRSFSDARSRFWVDLRRK